MLPLYLQLQLLEQRGTWRITLENQPPRINSMEHADGAGGPRRLEVSYQRPSISRKMRSFCSLAMAGMYSLRFLSILTRCTAV
jgi:hypothetical protein